MAQVPVLMEITGTVWKLLVAPGETVEDGQELMILESMKMEIPMTSPVAGTVHSIEVAEGDSVIEGAVVVVIEAA